MNGPLFWIGFIIFVLAALTFDLGIFHHNTRVIGFREAAGRVAIWIACATLFAAMLFYWHGRRASLEFVAGYVLEESLSFDNLFVFALVFRYFRVPAEYQHRVLFWGITNALVLRAIFIILGVTLIQWLHWIIYPMGLFLIYMGLRIFGEGEATIDPESTFAVKLVRRWFPITTGYRGKHFFVRDSKLSATPLLLALFVLESMDLLFATDSIPAVLAVTHDPFIVYTSNIFAILGLRSLYFVLAGMMTVFHYLHYGIAVILVLVGLDTLCSHSYQVPAVVLVAAVAAILAVAVGASVVLPSHERAK